MSNGKIIERAKEILKSEAVIICAGSADQRFFTFAAMPEFGAFRSYETIELEECLKN